MGAGRSETDSSGGPRAATAGSAAHVFVEDLQSPVVEGEDRVHLERALRLRPGETVNASDGRGNWRLARWQGSGRLQAAGPVQREARSAPEITIALALIKGDRLEWAVQKLTETGVDRIIPMVTERTVVRWDAQRAERGVARLRAVARSAAMQSRRTWLPEVEDLRTFRELAGAVAPLVEGPGAPDPGGGGHPAGAAMAVVGAPPPSLSRSMVLIGPEGGWSSAESQAGFPAVGLGPNVLRAETAAVAAACLLAALRYRLVAEIPRADRAEW